MSNLSTDEVEKIAFLARIAIPQSEISLLCDQLSSILDFVKALQSVDTVGVAETSQVTGLTDVWREDEVKPSEISPDKLLAATPKTKDGYIVVKRVLR